jgi:hypothetical protein
MAAAGVAAILALVLGAAIGRSIIPSPSPHHAPPAAASAEFADGEFTDRETGIALTYPATWHRVQSSDPQVRLLATAGSESLLVRVTKSEIENVKRERLPAVRQFTDQLLAADQRTKQLVTPEAISLAGLLGLRYRYTYTGDDGSTGAHVHYFLFKRGKMIQLVFQTMPATSLPKSEPEFERIASTLRSTGG